MGPLVDTYAFCMFDNLKENELDLPTQKLQMNDFNLYIHWNVMQCQNNKHLFKLLCDEEHEWIQMGAVNAMFPNIRKIVVSQVTLSAFQIECVLDYIDNNETFLQKIMIQNYNETSVTSIDLIKLYKQQFVDKGWIIAWFEDDDNTDEHGLIMADN